jgi:hypothetical protein
MPTPCPRTRHPQRPAVRAMVGLAAAVCLALPLWVAYKLLRVWLADADLHLLSLGVHKDRAFEGKVRVRG